MYHIIDLGSLRTGEGTRQSEPARGRVSETPPPAPTTTSVAVSRGIASTRRVPCSQGVARVALFGAVLLKFATTSTVASSLQPRLKARTSSLPVARTDTSEL